MFETGTSRRTLLGFLGTAPAAATITTVSPWASALDALFQQWGDEPAILRRSKEGRSLSRFRYHNAEAFFGGLDEGLAQDRFHLLYQVGIIIQLGISSHLLDLGFDDGWCARHIGLRVAKSLSYANATGFDHDDPETNMLGAVLTPYCSWRDRMMRKRGDGDGPFTDSQIRNLTRALLDRVRHATGHSRPRGRSKRSG